MFSLDNQIKILAYSVGQSETLFDSLECSIKSRNVIETKLCLNKPNHGAVIW